MSRFSLLVLNKDIVDNHEEEWNDDDILARSQQLSEEVIRIWPRP